LRSRKWEDADFTYTGIRVRNLPRALEFYKRVMEMKKMLKGKMMQGGIFVHLKSPHSSQRLQLNYYPPGTRFHKKYQSGSELDHLAFWETDVDRRHRTLLTKGARKALEPFSESRCRLAFVRDPHGIWIELIGIDRRAKSKRD
jgi:catechol 2,3-dioxygenase-like lactoylglutathione lyase family enzyme